MKKSKNYGLTKIITSVSLIILILLLVNFIPKFIRKDIVTSLPLDIEYKEKISLEGILIKNEKLYFSQTRGEVYGIIDEGKRVPVGSEVAQVISLKDMTFYKVELDNIENLLSQMGLNDSQDSEKTSASKIIIDNLISQIQVDIQNKDYDDLRSLKEKLLLNSPKYGEKSLEGQIGEVSLEDLKERKDEILKIISNYNERVFSKHSGLVSYKIDGFESLLSPSDLESLSDYIFDSDFKTNKEGTNTSIPIFKLVDGHEYYIAIKTPLLNTPSLSEKEYLEIEIPGIEDTKNTLRLKIVKRDKRGSEEVLILKSNELLEKLYDKRLIDIDVVTFKEDSFKIPITSLIKKDKQDGVFIKSFYGVVVFRPIIINAKDSDYLYVNKGDRDNKIEIKGKTYRTINEYSEVITRPNLVKEGQIIN